MNKKLSALASASASIAVCASLIAGSTFALFTSESKTNIAVTAGRVSISSTVQELKGYSALWDADSKTYTDQEIDPVENEGVFTNKGTFSYDGKTSLTLGNITAGDYVTFKIVTENSSTVKFKYETVITVESEDKTLFNGLDILVNGEPVDKQYSTAVSEWTVCEKDAKIPDITVKIGLPVTAGPEYMADKEGNAYVCNLCIGLYAVQANGNDDTYKNVYLVSGEADLNSVMESLQEAGGGTMALAEDMEVNAEKPLTVPEGADVTMDANGNTLTVKSDAKSAISVPKNSSLTLKGTNAESGEQQDIVLNSASTSKAAVEVKGSGAELNLEDVRIKCENANSSTTGSIPKASIEVSDQANVSVKGSVIDVVDETITEVDYKKPYGISATGTGTAVSVEETTVNVEGTAVALSAANSAIMNIENSVVNINNGGGSSPAVMVGTQSIIKSINTVVNITGDIAGRFPSGYYTGDNANVAVAYGVDASGNNDGNCSIYIYGGVVNLKPDSGIAIAVATPHSIDSATAYVGGGVVFHAEAGEGAKAAVFAAAQGCPIGKYEDTTIEVVSTSDNRNVEIWTGSDLYFNSKGSVMSESGNMPKP